MEVGDILAEEDGGASEGASEGASVDRVTPATNVEGPDTGLLTAKGEVMQEQQ